MRFSALAFVTRHLREESRARAPMLVRMALLALGLAWIYIYTFQIRMGMHEAAPGRTLFLGMAMMALTLAHLLGFSLFSSCITEEKEASTLPLLVMTGLHPLSILLGKAGTRLLGALSLVLVFLPVSLLCFALGGISLEQLLAAHLHFACFLLLLNAWGALASVLMSTSVAASALAFLFLFILHAAGPLLNLVRWLLVENLVVKATHPVSLGLQVAANFLVQQDPYATLARVLGTLYTGSVAPEGVGYLVTLAVLGYAWAGLAFHRLSRNLREANLPRKKRETAYARPRFWTAPRAWLQYPILWKELHFLHGRPWMRHLYPLFLVTAVWVVVRMIHTANPGLSPEGLERLLEGLGAMMMVYGLVLLVSRAAGYLSNLFAVEVREETFAALAALPGGLAPLVRQKLCAVAWLAWPDLVLVLVGVLWSGDNLVGIYQEIDRDPFFAFALTLLTLLAVPLFWQLTVYYSLRIKRGAVVVAGFTVVGCGYAYLTAMMIFSMGRIDSEVSILILPIVFCLLANGVVYGLNQKALQRAMED